MLHIYMMCIEHLQLEETFRVEEGKIYSMTTVNGQTVEEELTSHKELNERVFHMRSCDISASLQKENSVFAGLFDNLSDDHFDTPEHDDDGGGL